MAEALAVHFEAEIVSVIWPVNDQLQKWKKWKIVSLKKIRSFYSFVHEPPLRYQ